MDVIDDKDEWADAFRGGWLAHLEATGETDFKNKYAYVTNAQAPAGPGLDPASAKLLFVTSSGAYLKGRQAPFDAPNPRGDDRVHTFSVSEPLDAFAFAHDHYDHKYVEADTQTVLPLRHLEDLVQDGVVGAWAPRGVSFSGYLPDAVGVADRLVPRVLQVAKEEEVQGALLIPV